MSEQQKMLSDMVDSLFAELGSSAAVIDAWDRIEELGLPSLLVAEVQGGFGGSWDDARVVFRLAGYHALSLPVVEAVIANLIASPHGAEGRGTIASASEGRFADGHFTGVVKGAVASEGASFIVAPSLDGGALVLRTADGLRQARETLSGEARDVWMFDGAPAKHSKVDLFRLGAFARVAQISGALDGALSLSVDYVNERKQFGRPLAKFQAVQQNLATFAGEAAAANCAAVGAAQGLGRGAGGFEVASAKLRANRAAGTGAAIAHQVHGAIGFTNEYCLHRLTRKLWTWRSEFGGDSFWSAYLGKQVLERGADLFWADLTARTD
ncbi:acyl-CoA dehydrogenase family protein [Novosphingobium cyanobacteriorum]|uniref:Acyl-CoA/acyl-ACP dehydrogenase n=1 Tax=Novosphingobium cyanobacteriorum TaxID=3024215 RepID=A0ABT6CMZ2_9SPHN|nr:acyl-CoA dehydrogenase family protein [Novosphingobium cyanobacteriorum]MDF8334608.1 acyl-CoA/acyl-ACP dehydrogenase [Novosphingobium cyanobacteriorum]